MGSFARSALGLSDQSGRLEQETIAVSSDQAPMALIEQIRELVPFRYIAVSGLEVEGLQVGSGKYLLCDFPAAYLAEYYAGTYAGTDPLVAMFWAGQDEICRDSVAFGTAQARRDGHEVLDLLRRHAIAERTIIRVSGAKGLGAKATGAISLISDRPLTSGECDMMQLMAPTLHMRIARPAMTVLNDALKLSRGELYCLERAACGLTSEDIADEETYSVDTINTYLKTATLKLGAHNRVQAVAEAMRRGLIL